MLSGVCQEATLWPRQPGDGAVRLALLQLIHRAVRVGADSLALLPPARHRASPVEEVEEQAVIVDPLLRGQLARIMGDHLEPSLGSG